MKRLQLTALMALIVVVAACTQADTTTTGGATTTAAGRDHCGEATTTAAGATTTVSLVQGTDLTFHMVTHATTACSGPWSRRVPKTRQPL